MYRWFHIILHRRNNFDALRDFSFSSFIAIAAAGKSRSLDEETEFFFTNISPQESQCGSQTQRVTKEEDKIRIEARVIFQKLSQDANIE